MTPYYKKHTSGHLSQLFAFDDTELWPEHLQELLASSPPSVSFELKYPFFRGNWLTERGAELFETLHPKSQRHKVARELEPERRAQI
jgi:hypothetical protein